MDLYSNPVANVVKAFWSFVAYCASTAGIGMALAAGALWDAGVFPWPIALAIICGSLFVAWISTGWKRRYLKWVRPEE